MRLSTRCLITAIVAGMLCALASQTRAGDIHSVDAIFRDVSSGGCVKTEVFVSGHGGASDPLPEASVRISITNDCAEGKRKEILMDAFGTVGLAKDSLMVDREGRSARLRTAVRVRDSVTGRVIQLPLDLVWTATGEPTKSKTDFFYQPGNLSKTKKKVRSISQIAQAFGSLSAGSTNYIPRGSEDAEIVCLEEENQ